MGKKLIISLYAFPFSFCGGEKDCSAESMGVIVKSRDVL